MDCRQELDLSAWLRIGTRGCRLVDTVLSWRTTGRGGSRCNVRLSSQEARSRSRANKSSRSSDPRPSGTSPRSFPKTMSYPDNRATGTSPVSEKGKVPQSEVQQYEAAQES